MKLSYLVEELGSCDLQPGDSAYQNLVNYANKKIYSWELAAWGSVTQLNQS